MRWRKSSPLFSVGPLRLTFNIYLVEVNQNYMYTRSPRAHTHFPVHCLNLILYLTFFFYFSLLFTQQRRMDMMTAYLHNTFFVLIRLSIHAHMRY